MPKVTLSKTAVSDAAIAADAGRTYLEFALADGADCRFSFGATYVEADSQRLLAGLQRVFEGAPAQQAISFGKAGATLDVTTL